jgi:hypothetical protein
MIVIEKNSGEKIPYTESGNKLALNDELMFNLERYERDDANHLDVCRDKYGNLVSGVIPGIAEAYVAQIDIPAREYTETVEEPESGGEDGGESGENGGMEHTPNIKREPVPFSMDNVTLTLWALV